MKKILLIILLSTAMSENILMENLRPSTTWIYDKQLWGRQVKRAPRNDISSEIKEFSNYDDDRQQISDTRFIYEARKLPSIKVMRRADMTQFPQIDLLSSEKSKLETTKPVVLISIGIQEGKKTSDDSQEDCLAKRIYHQHNQNWQLQQPFYVDEPRWVEIKPDYVDASHRYLNLNDAEPYILSRGKKIFRIKDPRQVDRTIEDFEEFVDYPSKSRRLLIKNRIRRSVDVNEKSQSKIIDEENNREKGGKRKIGKNINHNSFNKKYEKNKLKNLAKRSPHEFKFLKQNQTIVNDKITANFIEEKRKIRRDDVPNDTENGNSDMAKINQDKKLNNHKNHFNTDINKRKKRSALLRNKKLPDIHKKYKTHEIAANVERMSENVERNETGVYEQMKTKTYINELKNLDTYDDRFVLSRGKHKLDSKMEDSNIKDTNRELFVERPWKIHYVHGKKLENEDKARDEENESEIDKYDIGMTENSQLTRTSDSENSEIKSYSNYREKRRACQNLACKIEPLRGQWLKDIEKEIQDLQRRDKHSDILEGLKLVEPYVISRGKKSSHEYKNEIYSVLKARDTGDADRSEVISLPLAKSLLRMLSMEIFRCNNDNCDINVNRLSNKRSPRDRRGSLEEILATYDPYYVARGKRASQDNFPTKMRSL